MNFNIVELPYSQRTDNSNLEYGEVRKNIDFRNLTESKGTHIIIEQTPSLTRSIMIYDNGFILYYELTSDYALVKTNKEIQEDANGLFIEF